MILLGQWCITDMEEWKSEIVNRRRYKAQSVVVTIILKALNRGKWRGKRKMQGSPSFIAGEGLVYGEYNELYWRSIHLVYDLQLLQRDAHLHIVHSGAAP